MVVTAATGAMVSARRQLSSVKSCFTAHDDVPVMAPKAFQIGLGGKFDGRHALDGCCQRRPCCFVEAGLERHACERFDEVLGVKRVKLVAGDAVLPSQVCARDLRGG